MKKYCTKCGKPFESVGREVICPSCKAAAVEDAKRAAVLKAKRASWTGESVPVRISGRASTLIREYGAGKSLSFAVALDALLQTSAFFKGMGVKWDDITPYKSHRRDKATSTAQDVPQDAQTAQEVKQVTQEAPQDAPQEVKTAAKKATSKAAGKAASKASTSKASTSKANASKAKEGF